MAPTVKRSAVSETELATLLASTVLVTVVASSCSSAWSVGEPVLGSTVSTRSAVLVTPLAMTVETTTLRPTASSVCAICAPSSSTSRPPLVMVMPRRATLRPPSSIVTPFATVMVSTAKSCTATWPSPRTPKSRVPSAMAWMK